jgi:D-3-phosphoglycerate dehydrogenase
MVVNAPTSNIVSAAELAVALMLAAARHVAPANAALKNGEWKRSKYTGIELYEKTVGIVGLGRIGVLVAQRLSAFGMKVIAYDPYVQAGRAAQMGVRLVSLDELLEQADFMSVHLPKTPETLGLIGEDQLAKVKPNLVLVNAARGGIVDEQALYNAVKEGRVAAAGLDVFASERAPTARCSSSRTSWPPRTSAPPPTRRRRRPASRSRSRCASPSEASSSPTRSTSRAA